MEPKSALELTGNLGNPNEGKIRKKSSVKDVTPLSGKDACTLDP